MLMSKGKNKGCRLWHWHSGKEPICGKNAVEIGRDDHKAIIFACILLSFPTVTSFQVWFYLNSSNMPIDCGLKRSPFIPFPVRGKWFLTQNYGTCIWIFVILFCRISWAVWRRRCCQICTGRQMNILALQHWAQSLQFRVSFRKSRHYHF